MKAVLIYAEGDYGAESFEYDGMTPATAYDIAKSNGGSAQWSFDGVWVTIEAHDFGEVDPEFVGFMRDIMRDGGQTRNKNFYIVKEAK